MNGNETRGTVGEPTQMAIEVEHLTKQYADAGSEGGFRLENISLTLPAGMVMGLIGENGAGKSTLIRLLMGLTRPDNGTIRLLGKDIRKDFHLTKQDIGIVFDDTGISPELNVRQVNSVMKDVYRAWDEEQFRMYCRQFDLPERRRFKTFSRGMKMKLGIAMAFSHHAKLLIMDEPTNGLDPLVRDEVVRMLCDFTRDASCSVLISSHIVSDLDKICDYIAFLHKGRLLISQEKDRLYEDYGILHCTQEELSALPSGAVVGSNDTHYGLEVLVKKRELSGERAYRPIDLEKLFVFMAKRK